MSLAYLSKLRRSRPPALLVLLALAAVCLLGVCLLPGGSGAAASGSGGCEPRLPLDLTWTAADSDPVLPGTVLTLMMTARTDLLSVRLELLLPENVSLLSGPGDFQGKLGRGEERRLGLRISRNGAAKLQARVTAVTPGGLVFQRGVSLELAADNGSPARRDAGRLVCAPDGGRQVREFPAEAEREVRR